LWRLAEVVDVPVDQPRSIGQQRTQVNDRLGAMVLGTFQHHVVVFLAILTTTLRRTLLVSSCFSKNAKVSGGPTCAFLRKLRRLSFASSASLLEMDENVRAALRCRTPARAEREGK